MFLIHKKKLLDNAFSSFAKMKLQVQTLQPTGRTHSGTVVFLHGSGLSGNQLLESIRYLVGNDWKFPHIKVILPTAPSQPSTLLNGQNSNIWFERLALAKRANENRASMETAYDHIKDIIKSENDNGIPTNRIVIGGFSMGGALALHAGFHVNHELAGIFTCSAFLNDASIVFETLQTRKSQQKGHLPKLLMFHGDRDNLVPLSRGKETFDKLVQLGVDGEMKLIESKLHELKANELRDIHRWILELLPPLDSDIVHKL